MFFIFKKPWYLEAPEASLLLSMKKIHIQDFLLFVAYLAKVFVLFTYFLYGVYQHKICLYKPPKNEEFVS